MSCTLFPLVKPCFRIRFSLDIYRIFPNAVRVVDCFHVMKRLGEALEEMRLKEKRLAVAEQKKLERQHRKRLKSNTRHRKWYRKTHPKNYCGKKRGRKPQRSNTRFTPPTLENGDTRVELLTRNRYLICKSPDKWSDRQKRRAKILFREYPKMEEAYWIANKNARHLQEHHRQGHRKREIQGLVRRRVQMHFHGTQGCPRHNQITRRRSAQLFYTTVNQRVGRVAKLQNQRLPLNTTRGGRFAILYVPRHGAVRLAPATDICECPNYHLAYNQSAVHLFYKRFHKKGQPFHSSSLKSWRGC